MVHSLELTTQIVITREGGGITVWLTSCLTVWIQETGQFVVNSNVSY